MNRILTILLTLVLLLLSVTAGFAQDECGNNALGVAQSHYDIGQFNDCIRGLKRCIGLNGFDYNQKTQAYRLCAESYLAMDSVAEADNFIKLLVSADDNFQADEARDPIRFRLRVAYVRTQLRSLLTSSVSKKVENIDLAPATIQILTAKDIEDRGYTDLLAVFSDLPGFDISQSFGISYAVLYQRGYRSPALTERTMIMVDGIEDNDLWTNAAFITKQYPLSSIKRIEVIYGPASTIYGANAFCGVINIVTKDEEDLFSDGSPGSGEKPKNVAINLQTGGASYNTKYVDGTAAFRKNSVMLSVTGRVYLSDGFNLTSDPYWSGVPNFSSAAYTSKMTMKYNADSIARYVGPYFQVNSDSTKIVPTAAGVARADSLDKAYYKTSLKNASVFKNNINDFYVSAKLQVDNFKFGFQFWNKNEGSIGDYVDNYSAQNSAYTNWQVREYFIYANYSKKVSEHLNLSSLTYYRYCDFGNDSKGTDFVGYGNGGVSDYGFITGTGLPHYSITDYYEASNELRSEMKALYTINDQFDILAGTEFTTGVLQANYLTSSIEPVIVNGTAPDSAGGNNLVTYTVSGYATASYKNLKHHLNIDLGGRVDDNHFREVDGYGTVFNPRVDAVYYPGSFVFKAIYATAFLDASDQNKFSTSSSRKLDNPTLAPERVQNYEISGRYKFGSMKNSYVEIAAYRSYYTNTLALVPVEVATSVSASGVTNQYQDIGKSLIYGIQAASSIFINKNLSLYANATYNDPMSIFTSSTGADSSVRTGDIATISANAGVNISLPAQRLNLNVRVNIVGDKPTGPGTSVSSNPYTVIGGYELLNATLGYRIVKGVLVQVGCNNILNTQYYSPGVRTADGAVYAPSIIQPGRNYMARVIFDLKK